MLFSPLRILIDMVLPKGTSYFEAIISSDYLLYVSPYELKKKKSMYTYIAIDTDIQIV